MSDVTKPDLMTALQHLALMAQRVTNQFTSGNNPTFVQIENLQIAIEMANAEKVCGHSVFEDCDCLEGEQ